MKFALLWTLFLLTPSTPQDAGKPSASPLDRVSIIGASASAGFGIGSFPGGDVVLADIVAASLKIKANAVQNLASMQVYSDMAGYAEKTAAALEERSPSLIIAIDYLFWCVHGDSAGNGEKVLASALAGLEKCSCPILLGDIPDVTPATQGQMGMITKEMLPSAGLRQAANKRIADWAKGRKNVVVVPFAAMSKKVYDGVEIKLRGNVWKAGEVKRLIQADRLHPTLEGLVGLWITAADAWLNADKKLVDKSFELKSAVLVKAAEAVMSGGRK